MQTRSTSSIEILEARIAPALFFVQSNALAVLDSAGNNAEDLALEAAAKTTVNATTAVLLKAGDKLIFDADNNHLQSAGDEELVKITAGSALVFLTDTLGAVNGHFDKNEISGLAVSKAFNATIQADVRGSIVTALDPVTNAFTASATKVDLQHGASIAGLTVTGKIGGTVTNVAHVFAGGSLTNFTGGTALTAGSPGLDASVDGLVATGKEADARHATFNGGGKTLTVTFNPSIGEKGGDITNLVLPKGALVIGTGSGGNSATTPGKGGSITGVTIANCTVDLDISSGGGGVAFGTSAGGAAGKIANVTITDQGSLAQRIFFFGGYGGDAVKGAGGAGAAISGLHLTVLNPTDTLFIRAGKGGDSSGGPGGVGGGLTATTIDSASIKHIFQVLAGAGGNGASAGAGGNGGVLSGLTLTCAGVSAAMSSVEVFGGSGGHGGANGKGGNGGGLAGSNVHFTGAITGDLQIGAGLGGEGGAMKGAGGNGGALTASTIKMGAVSQGAQIFSGAGGDSHNAAGGNGGAFTGITIENLASLVNLIAGSGEGGGVKDGKGNGGKGGGVSGLTYNNTGGIDSFGISGASGGAGHGQGNGGAGGGLAKVTVNSVGNIVTFGKFYTANGTGNAGATGGNGGAGGTLASFTFHDKTAGGVTGNIFLFAAKGGAGTGLSGKGGAAGKISTVTLDGPKAHFFIGEGATDGSGSDGHGGAGGTGAAATGGAGMSISGVSGTAGELTLVARDGGTAAAGKGGPGGGIAQVKITNAAAIIHQIAAGNGGNGAVARGAGGSVNGVTVADAIGVFGVNFNTFLGSSGSGGLFAGLAGIGGGTAHNGSIGTITAARIAAILAGHPSADALSAANAVYAITGVKVPIHALGADFTIGVDVNHNGLFDFLNGMNFGYHFGEGDTAIDGMVIVRQLGLTATSLSGNVPLQTFAV